jgi:hypothetical protein
MRARGDDRSTVSIWQRTPRTLRRDSIPDTTIADSIAASTR